MEKMEKSFEVAARNFSTVRTGRANPGMLDRVQARPHRLPSFLDARQADHSGGVVCWIRTPILFYEPLLAAADSDTGTQCEHHLVIQQSINIRATIKQPQTMRCLDRKLHDSHLNARYSRIKP